MMMAQQLLMMDYRRKIMIKTYSNKYGECEIETIGELVPVKTILLKP